MRKRKEEVAGKPTQYNLQTQEYNWRELPDTHFAVKEAGPRIRNYEVPAGAPSDPDRGNARRRRADEGGAMRNILGGGVDEAGAVRDGGEIRGGPPPPMPPSPQPMPMPSRPQQEAYAGAGRHGLGYAAHGEVPRSTGEGGDGRSRGGAGAPGLDLDALRAADLRAIERMNLAYAPQPPPVQSQPLSQPVYIAPWSHEDLKRQVLMNHMEANRSYLRQMQ